MDKPLILTDVDDVCLNWIAGFRMYASRVLGHKITGLPQSWDMSEWLGVATSDEATAMVNDFNHGKWEFGCLPPVADAEKWLPRLAKDHDIIAITCCSTDPATVALRRANLYHVFGDIFQDVICQPLGTNKTTNLLKHGHRNVVAWVEDKAEAAMHGHKVGYRSFLMHQDHNKKHRDENPHGPLHYVKDWSAINDLLV